MEAQTNNLVRCMPRINGYVQVILGGGDGGGGGGRLPGKVDTASMISGESYRQMSGADFF